MNLRVAPKKNLCASEFLDIWTMDNTSVSANNRFVCYSIKKLVYTPLFALIGNTKEQRLKIV